MILGESSWFRIHGFVFGFTKDHKNKSWRYRKNLKKFFYLCHRPVWHFGVCWDWGWSVFCVSYDGESKVISPNYLDDSPPVKLRSSHVKWIWKVCRVPKEIELRAHEANKSIDNPRENAWFLDYKIFFELGWSSISFTLHSTCSIISSLLCINSCRIPYWVIL